MATISQQFLIIADGFWRISHKIHVFHDYYTKTITEYPVDLYLNPQNSKYYVSTKIGSFSFRLCPKNIALRIVGGGLSAPEHMRAAGCRPYKQ